MVVYHCVSCNFSTKRKTEYSRHLLTKKHISSHPKVTIESPQSHHLVTPKSPFLEKKVTPKSPFLNSDTQNEIHPNSSKNIICKYCQKSFKFKQGLYRHIKFTCKKSKDEDLKELARLLNEKNSELEFTQKEINIMKRQIEKLTTKLQIQNINHGTINHVQNVTFQLLNHSESDYSHLTEYDYLNCIRECNYCVKALIERVHFNQIKPENMNIYISNIKGDYAMVYKQDKWQIVNKKTQIDDIFDYNEVILENWYDESKEKFPDIIHSFNRYLQNKDKSDIINDVKKQIIVMLYNNRNMIQDNNNNSYMEIKNDNE
jgi:hypothetical protein